MEELFNIPLAGPLFLEHTFYHYDSEPILFVFDVLPRWKHRGILG